MKLKHLIKTSVIGLKTNRIRSMLTVLGIVIGITAIILIVSVGRGAESLILGQLGNMGGDMVVIRPGQEPKGPSDFAESIFSDSLKDKDIKALQRKSNVPYLKEVVPSVIVPGSVSYRGETYRSVNFGWSAELMKDMFDIQIETGTLFDDRDIKNRSAVAIIGSEVKEELFGNSSAIGKNIRIKGKNLRVVGVIAPKGHTSFFNVDDVVLVPYTTAQKYLLGIDHYHEVIVMIESTNLVERSIIDIENTLRASHGITDPSKDDFFVVSQKGMVEQIGTILNALTVFLSMVVAISLVVGGVGVMNIMLVSVTERTKEIGLRKSIGATNKDILIQFIFEAIILTVSGGIIGIILGSVFSLLASFVLTNFYDLYWPFSFSVKAAALSVSISALVGLIFGIYPAKKASEKSPIDALRYE